MSDSVVKHDEDADSIFVLESPDRKYIYQDGESDLFVLSVHDRKDVHACVRKADVAFPVMSSFSINGNIFYEEIYLPLEFVKSIVIRDGLLVVMFRGDVGVYVVEDECASLQRMKHCSLHAEDVVPDVAVGNILVALNGHEEIDCSHSNKGGSYNERGH